MKNNIIFVLIIIFLVCDLSSEEVKLPDGSIYNGTLNNNLFDGYGILIWRNGDIYEGQFLEGIINGTGKITSRSYIYIGGFKDGLFEGEGKITYTNGGSYEGLFKNGLYHGYGTNVDQIGNIYIGNFEYGIRTGEGSVQLISGDSFFGEYENDMFNGKGRYVERNGNVYTGSFKDNLFHGEGKYITIDNKIFEGLFINGNFPEKYEKRKALLNSFIVIIFILSILLNIIFIIKIKKYRVIT